MSAEEWDLSRGRVIEASAGTGKTHTIATVVSRLVAEEELSIPSILVTTFAEAAAAELRERVRLRMRDEAASLRSALSGGAAPPGTMAERWMQTPGTAAARLQRLERAVVEIDQAAICTIHSLCQRILTELPFEASADIGRVRVEDVSELHAAVLADSWAKAVSGLSGDELGLVATGLDQAAASEIVRAALGHPDLPISPQTGDGNAVQAIERAASEALEAADPQRLTRAADWLRANSVAGRLLRQLAQRPVAGGALQVLASVAALCDELRESADGLPKVVLAAHAQRTSEVVELVAKLCALGARMGTLLASAVDAARVQVAMEARRSAAARKQRERSLTFDDMINDVHRALMGKEGVRLARALREKYRAILVDEFQDTDRRQAEIFRAAFGDAASRLFYVGDPKQAIYLFRGADVDAYLEATGALASHGARSTLQTNYRSDMALVDSVQALMEVERGGSLGGPAGDMPGIAIPRVHARDREDRLLDARGGGASGLRFLHTADDPPATAAGMQHLLAAEVPVRIATAVRAELEQGLTLPDARTGVRRALMPSDIAILVRTNRELDAFQAALRQIGIASSQRSRESIWRSVEADELQRILRAVGQPGSLAVQRSAAATEIVGMESDEVRALEAQDGAAANAYLPWILGLHAELERHGPVPMVRWMLDEPLGGAGLPARQRMLACVGGERSVTNLLHLSELLGQMWRMGMRTAGELAERMAEGRAQAGGTEAEELAQRIESDGPAVQLCTMHGAKGLQWPVVWLPSYVRSSGGSGARSSPVLPTVVDGVRVLAVGGTARERAAQEYAREEAREGYRMMYVALTRAQYRCNVAWGRAHNAANAGSPMGALLHGRGASDAAAAAASARAALSDPATLTRDLNALRSRAQGDGLSGRVMIEPLPAASTDRWSSQSLSQALAPARRWKGAVPAAARTSSFSALTRGVHEGAAETRVRTDDAEQGETAAQDASASAPLLSREVLPAGPEYGDVVHRVLEAGRRVLDGAELLPIVHDACRAVRGRVRAADLAAGLRSIAGQRLLPGEVRGVRTGDATLRVLLAGTAKAEMSYIMPVGMPAAAQRALALTPARLAAAFERGGELAARYAPLARALTAPALHGHLVGFIDLVCQHEGRWYVLDYKTNALGTTLGAFTVDAIDDAMLQSHYVLQYHLYSLAVHRWLRSRLPDYDYERHFGGALYLFVRAMGAGRPAGSGVFADRPTLALMNALDAACSGQELAA